jgi:hypothetical protein
MILRLALFIFLLIPMFALPVQDEVTPATVLAFAQAHGYRDAIFEYFNCTAGGYNGYARVASGNPQWRKVAVAFLPCSRRLAARLSYFVGLLRIQIRHRGRIVVGGNNMNQTFTAVVKNDGEWWIGWVEEVPGVNCQERSRDELLKTLRVTLMEALEMNRADARDAGGKGYEELSIVV